MEYVIDRIEGNYAICENNVQNIVEIQLSVLPENIKEGDVVYKKNGVYEIDMTKTMAKKEYISNKMNNLWK